MKNTDPISILIIDDNPGDQVLLEENIRSTTLTIKKLVFSDTLGDGILALKADTFSLVFLDLFLPDSNGLCSLSEILKVNGRVPVIIYSGMADTQTALEAIKLGAQDFLIKGDYTLRLLEKTVTYSIERKKNIDALKASDEKYELVSRATHDMVWDWDLKSDTVYRNKEGFQKTFKTKDSKVSDQSEEWLKRIHPDDREKTACVIQKAIADPTQSILEAEFRIIRDDGTTGCLEDRGFIQRNDQGVAIRIIGASHDITDRKNAETKVKLSEERFKSLVQNSKDLLAILDINGIYTYVSPTSYNLLGFEPEYFIGKSLVECIHQEDQEILTRCLANVREDHFITVPIFRFMNAEGEWRWIESTATNALDDPAVGGIVINSRDVTERKISDDEIAKLSMVAKNTASSVFILNQRHEVLWVNDAFTKITEHSFEEACGALLSELLYHSESQEVNFTEVFKNIQAGIPYEAERVITTKSGKSKHVWMQIQGLFNSDGEPTQYFGMHTDITLQKELEERVEMEKVLKQKQITEAVYSAQENERAEIGRELHDNVNQLLGAIRLYVNMAKTDEEGRDALLTDASDFTLTAIEEIRKLSKTLITPLIKEVGLVDSIKELAAEIMAVHPLRILVLAENFQDSVFNDKFKLNIFRICQEQINNILKHAGAAEAHILIEENDDNFQINIIDNGVGFDTSKRRQGVGITNIKSRSELYNGTVTLTSKEGAGTTLSIDFPKSSLLKVPEILN